MGAFDTSIGMYLLALPFPPPVSLLVGALLLGFSLDIYLYGFACYQYLVYKTTKFDDPIQLRILVAVLFVIDTSQTIAEFYGVWHFAVENYANPIALARAIWITPFCCVASGLTALIVEAFLIHRLYRLSGLFWLSLFLLFAAVVAFTCGVIAPAWAGLTYDATKWKSIIPISITWRGTEAGVDVVIAVVLSRAFWRSKTGLTRTNTILNRCIRTSIQSGLFTSVIAVADVLIFAFWPVSYLYAILGWPIGRIYSNSLLYTLVIRKELADIAHGTADMRDTRSISFPMSPQTNSIHVQRHTVSEVEAANHSVKASLDRYIVITPPEAVE
ncbi:hypothetical protein DL96DRAFT_1817633 [Flagelloscypha sp. PMI_526]|nr:hypothetical protein DL96DRAFT_1817633 [Flagelloscypha sp. PMI_526]